MFTVENVQKNARWKSTRWKTRTVRSAYDVEDVKRSVRHKRFNVGRKDDVLKKDTAGHTGYDGTMKQWKLYLSGKRIASLNASGKIVGK